MHLSFSSSGCLRPQLKHQLSSTSKLHSHSNLPTDTQLTNRASRTCSLMTARLTRRGNRLRHRLIRRRHRVHRLDCFSIIPPLHTPLPTQLHVHRQIVLSSHIGVVTLSLPGSLAQLSIHLLIIRQPPPGPHADTVRGGLHIDRTSTNAGGASGAAAAFVASGLRRARPAG